MSSSRRDDALPKLKPNDEVDELFGRANVAMSAAKPDRIFALIEAKPGSVLYRSEDSGTTWTLVNGQGTLITRRFYSCERFPTR